MTTKTNRFHRLFAVGLAIAAVSGLAIGASATVSNGSFFITASSDNGKFVAQHGMAVEDNGPGPGPVEPDPEETYGANSFVFTIDTDAENCTTPEIRMSVGAGTTITSPSKETRVLSGTRHSVPESGQWIVTGNVTRIGQHSVISAGAGPNCLTSVDYWGPETKTEAASFSGAANLRSVAKPPSTIQNMSYMFSGAKSMNGDLRGWDVSNVTNMASMFSGATSFNGNISTWNVSNVTNMEAMFNAASAFTGDISNWQTGNVTNMAGMFRYNKGFNGDLSNWDVSKVANMDTMFMGSNYSNDLSNWNVCLIAEEPANFSYDKIESPNYKAPNFGVCG